jgi:hypothetical protein
MASGREVDAHSLIKLELWSKRHGWLTTSLLITSAMLLGKAWHRDVRFSTGHSCGGVVAARARLFHLRFMLEAQEARAECAY